MGLSRLVGEDRKMDISIKYLNLFHYPYQVQISPWELSQLVWPSIQTDQGRDMSSTSYSTSSSTSSSISTMTSNRGTGIIWCRLFPSVCVAGQQQRVQDIVWFDNSQEQGKEEQEQVQEHGQNQDQEQEQEQYLDFVENVSRKLSSFVWMGSGEPEKQEEKVYIRLK